MKTGVFMGGSCCYHTLHAQCIHDDRYDGCKQHRAGRYNSRSIPHITMGFVGKNWQDCHNRQ